jgi:hypothetical protein
MNRVPDKYEYGRDIFRILFKNIICTTENNRVLFL